MLVRDLEHPDTQATKYRAHGGGTAHMILDARRHLQSIMFLAHASVPVGNKLEGHVDPMEEIYIIHSGTGEMQVDDEVRPVSPGDCIHIPLGSYHELTNTGDQELTILVVAGLIPG